MIKVNSIEKKSINEVLDRWNLYLYNFYKQNLIDSYSGTEFDIRKRYAEAENRTNEYHPQTI